MSHWTKIETQIRDAAALREACGELGLELLENTQARGYGDNRITADLVIRLKGPYDIALQRGGSGYGLTTDWWGGHVEKEVGKDYGRLLQLYGVHKTRLEARRKGFMVQRRTLGDGSIKLTIGGVR
jgi:hypothetical protein